MESDTSVKIKIVPLGASDNINNLKKLSSLFNGRKSVATIAAGTQVFA